MAIKINKNVYVETNVDDVGIFDGLNVLSYNTDELPKKVDEGTYLNDLITNDEKNYLANQNKLYSNIPERSVVVGADFQAIEVTAKVQTNNRDFLLVTTNENFSGNNFVSVLKMYELKEDKLVDCEIGKIRTTLSQMKDTFHDIFQEIIKAAKENNHNIKYNDLINTVKNDIDNLYAKNNDGTILINVTSANYQKHIENFKKAYLDNKDIINFSDNIKNSLTKILNYQDENKVAVNSISIINNQNIDDIKIDYTKIDRYNITLTEPKEEKANAVKLEYSVRPKIMSENYYDKFKTNYISDEVRKDLPTFIEKAIQDPFAAYHLAKQCKKELKNDIFTINSLLKKARENTLTTEEKIKFNNANENAMKVIKKIAEVKISSINFNANYYKNNFVSEKKKPEERQVSAFFDLLLKTAKGKINEINNIENITMTNDNSRIRNNASTSPIFYNGNLPRGNAIVELEKKASLRGTMGKELVADIRIIPSQIIFPEKTFIDKNQKEQTIKAKIIAPSENQMVATKSIMNILTLITKMNKEGEITNKNGDTFLINIAKKIEKAKDLAYGENQQLEWKSNIKTKEIFENIIKELDNRKDNPAELVNFVNDIVNGKVKNKVINKNSQAITTAIKNNFVDENQEWQNSVIRVNSRIINKKLENNIFVSEKDGLKDTIKREVNRVIAKIDDYSKAYREIFAINNEENLLYKMINQKPNNIFVSSNTININDEKGEREYLAPSFNFRQNNSLESFSKKIEVDGKEYNIFVPDAELVGKTISNVFQQNSEFNNVFLKRVADFRAERGENNKRKSYDKAESLDISSLINAVENPDSIIENNNSDKVIDMTEIESIKLAPKNIEEIENSYIQEEISDFEEYKDVNLNIHQAFEEDLTDIEEMLGIKNDDLLDYEEPETPKSDIYQKI